MPIVEFVGLPGAGKTSLSRATAAALRARGLRVSEPVTRLNELAAGRRAATKLASCTRQAARAPATAATLVRLVAASRQPSWALAVKNLINLLLQQELSRAAPAGHVALHDQGVFQALWSLELEAQNPPRLDAALYARLAGDAGPRLVVFLDSDAVRVLERLSTRSDSGRFAKTANARPGLSSVSVELLERLYGYATRISEQGGFAVARIDNRERGLAEATEEAVRIVSEFLDRALLPNGMTRP